MSSAIARKIGPLVLAFHGNAEVARWLVPWASTVSRETNACVVLPEYRGYDGLGGIPTYGGSALDARAALQYVTDTLGVEAGESRLFRPFAGVRQSRQSLPMCKRLARSCCRRRFPRRAKWEIACICPGSVPFGASCRASISTRFERVRSMAAPVWVAHGDKDLVIPVHMGREVFQAAEHKGDLLVVHRAGHNDVAEVGGSAYWTGSPAPFAETRPRSLAPLEQEHDRHLDGFREDVLPRFAPAERDGTRARGRRVRRHSEAPREDRETKHVKWIAHENDVARRLRLHEKRHLL